MRTSLRDSTTWVPPFCWGLWSGLCFSKTKWKNNVFLCAFQIHFQIEKIGSKLHPKMVRAIFRTYFWDCLKMSPKWSKKDPKVIFKWPQNDPRVIPRISYNDPKLIQDESKTTPMRSQDKLITNLRWFKIFIFVYIYHIWSSYMIITYNDHIWWSYVNIIYDHHIWSSYILIVYDDHIWSSYPMIIYDHHI